VALGVLYFSFEPFVRRKWPQTIVSWSRLLAGGVRDPLVGRDVLCGIAIGIVLELIFEMGLLLRASGTPYVTGPALVFDNLAVASHGLFLISLAIVLGIGSLFFLFLSRSVLRNQWLAVGVTMLIVAVYFLSFADVLGWTVSLAFSTVIVITLMRFGLLSLVTAYFFRSFVSTSPLGTNFTVWYAHEIVFTILIVLVLSFVAFRVSLAGRPLIAQE